MLLQAECCTLAMNGSGTTTAGTKLVPEESELILPTDTAFLMSQMEAS